LIIAPMVTHPRCWDIGVAFSIEQVSRRVNRLVKIALDLADLAQDALC
jgi:hypothetical protein